MHDQPALLLTLAAAFGMAFVLGFLATKLRLPPLVGYLVAGIVIGPHSPGFVADIALASQLAEIGVILLLFGVGLHFSPGDLHRVRGIALPGAVIQMAVAATLGFALARWWGWSAAASVVFGASLMVASTVVVLRVLEDRGLLDSVDGRIAVGWLVVEDLAVVLVLVLLPSIVGLLGAPGREVVSTEALVRMIGMTILKVVAFIALMAVVGRRVVPWLLTVMARTGSRELFTLAVLGVSLGVAVGASSLFGVSFALGAFVAGVVISESDLSYRAGADALPMQDAFAVLFFVSAGMLIDPTVLIEAPMRLVGTVGVILIGNSLTTAILLVSLRHPLTASLRLAVSFGQIGEFSFIVAALGVSLGVLPEDGRSLIMAAALITIVINPLLFHAIDALREWLAYHPELVDRLERRAADPVIATGEWAAPLSNHVILIGYGRVGRTIGEAFRHVGIPFVAIDQDRRTVEAIRAEGVNAIFGDATRLGILQHAHPERARVLVIAAPDPYHARHVIELVRQTNPSIEVVVRTHGEQEQRFFERMGVNRALMGERELAYGMAYYGLRAAGCSDDDADQVMDVLREETRDPLRERAPMTP